MKANKLMLAAMLVAGLTMAFNTSCKKKEKDEPIPVPVDTTKTPDPDPQPGEETPEVADPAEGYVTMVIQVPEGVECNGIAFKGTLDGTAWTGADQYLGEAGPTDKDNCIKFAKVGDSKVWYSATFKVGTAAWGEEIYLAGKICLIYTNDGSWEGQAVDWAFVDDYSTVDHSQSSDGNIQVNGTTGKLYITVDHFQMSECATPQEYKVTFKTPAWCEGKEVDLEVAGSMNGWGDGTILCTKVGDQEYTATFTTTPGAEFKVRGVGGWDVEIQSYNAEKGEWGGCANNTLGEEAEVVVDYTDAELYRWSVCAPAEPEQPEE
ncbi:MAG: hypothetical protein IJS73_02075 [Paludibacteraceae bacterium]|nr:hypothetical protein [Paludibacteraceae bacterium]